LICVTAVDLPPTILLSESEAIMFDIRLNEEQRAFQLVAREFAQEEIKPLALELDSKPNWEDRIPWDALK
jgi:alkylation response protein AidB-like acyl-CoA dehydrogenase